MNHHYNEAAARRILFNINSTSTNHAAGDVQVLSRADFTNINVADVRYPPSVRLMEDLEGGSVEAMFKTYGVISAKTLPPIVERPQSTSVNTIRNLRQQVRVTGLGFSAFDDDATALQQVHTLFQGHVHDRTIAPFDFSPYEGYTCIEARARFFTDRDLIPYDKHQEFLPGVDPEGVLSELQPAALIHGTDNMVEYCRRRVDEDGTIAYEIEDPRTFREGDIVEVSFSFVGVRIRDNKMLVYLNLRALALVDDSVRKDAENSAALSRLAMNQRTPKRKMRFLPDFDVRALHGLKKHRSEPVLTAAPPLAVTAGYSKDDIDVPSKSCSSSDGSTDVAESYVTVDTADLSLPSSDLVGHSESDDESDASQSLASGTVSSGEQNEGDELSSSTTSSIDPFASIDLPGQTLYQVPELGADVGGGVEAEDDFVGIDMELHEAWEAFQREQGLEDVDGTEYASGTEDGEIFDFDIEPMVVDF